jgi:hypothetical protein
MQEQLRALGSAMPTLNQDLQPMGAPATNGGQPQ